MKLTRYELNVLRRVAAEGPEGRRFAKGSTAREAAFTKLSDEGLITIEYSRSPALAAVGLHRRLTITSAGLEAIREANRKGELNDVPIR